MATKLACMWAGAVVKKSNLSIWTEAEPQKRANNTEKANGEGRTD